MFGLIKYVDNSSALDWQDRPYTTLGYANGPGGLNGSRPDLRSVNTSHKDYLQQATVLIDYESHSSEDIGKITTGTRTHMHWVDCGLFGVLLLKSFTSTYKFQSP